MSTFWKIAPHLVDHMFSSYFEYIVLVILVISLFGFEGMILVLIGSVPDLCILFTFCNFSYFPLRFLGPDFGSDCTRY